MSFFPYGFVATVERPGGYDRYGHSLPGEPPHMIEKCARHRLESIEVIDGQATVVTKEQLVVDDSEADVKDEDVLIYPDGSRWSVQGDPERPESPFTGWKPGVTMNVKKVK